MDLTAWAPLIAFGGVAIGAVGTWVTQWLTRRQTLALSIATQKTALRTDRREAIYAFLEAIQDAEKVAERVRRTQNIPGQGPGLGQAGMQNFTDQTIERTEIMHRIWFRQKALEVVGTEELASHATAYALKVRDVLNGQMPSGKSSATHVQPEKAKFVEVARGVLDAGLDS